VSDLVPVLESLGVQVVSEGEKEIKGLCPVHVLAVGREDTHPSWYMNAVTGAWICFSCQSKGSLHSLISTLGGDESLIERMPIVAMKAKVETWHAGAPVEPEERLIVSERAFNRNPYPPIRMVRSKGITPDSCEQMNIRWNKEGKYFMLPVYSFKGELMGWQEKSTGYFNNVPKGMKRSESLFGYGAVRTGEYVTIVESPLDAARFLSHDIESVAIYGSYTSAAQLEAVSRVAKRVVLAFDNDEAGHVATAIASRMLTNLGVDVRFFSYDVGTDGMDPGELSVDQLVDGFTNASALPPATIRVASDKLRKRPYKKKDDEDPRQSMREWAAQARRSSHGV
jgi:hypothetical protein